jgi:nucleotide-binding universal stress UspA family protein
MRSMNCPAGSNDPPRMGIQIAAKPTVTTRLVRRVVPMDDGRFVVFKSLLLCLKSDNNDIRLQTALEIAASYGSCITGLYVRHMAHLGEPLPRVEASLAGLVMQDRAGAIDTDAAELAADMSRAEDALQHNVIGAFFAAARAKSVTAVSEVFIGTPREGLLKAAQAKDLIIMGHGHYEDSVVKSVAGDLIRMIPKPFLLVKQRTRGLEHIAVAYDGSAGADRALAAAANLARGLNPRAPSISLIAVVRGGEIGRTILAPARKYLEAYKIGCHERIAAGDPAAAILEAACTDGVELLCMGAYGHTRARELLLGSVTQTVISERDLPLLVCH